MISPMSSLEAFTNLPRLSSFCPEVGSILGYGGVLVQADQVHEVFLPPSFVMAALRTRMFHFIFSLSFFSWFPSKIRVRICVLVHV